MGSLCGYRKPGRPTRFPVSILAGSLFASCLLISADPSNAVPNTTGAQRAVLLEAEVGESPPRITLRWDQAGTPSAILISRKGKNDNLWVDSLATLPGSATFYVDSDVQVGVGYEYKVWTNPSQEGYVYAGIRLPAVHDRGTIQLIVDNTKSASLEFEIDRFRRDLVGDGWEVIQNEVSPSDSVVTVKSLISSRYNEDPSKLKGVILLGRVPVPYSGNFAPDGHSDHMGAWPADCFYTDLDGAWTDTTVNNTAATGTRNDNIPGDGKFDQNTIPSDPELMIGRIDLSNMSLFPLNQTELLRQYLDKDHRFRHGETPAQIRALVDDNFTSHSEGFAQNGWRLASLTGIANVNSGNWSDMTNSPYLWAYGCGAGGYTGASGVTNTQGYVSTTYQAVFQMLFGSYFGDWDNSNSFLRAPLCNPDYGLTSCWAGRPNWQFHHMGMGEPIGDSVRISLTYSPYLMGLRVRGPHVALMGDPTLRLHPVVPPGEVGVIPAPDGLRLSWVASPDAGEGYHVYRAASIEGPYQRLTAIPVIGTSYLDENPPEGDWFYMVRTLKLQPSASGTYYNLSQGAYSNRVSAAGELPAFVESWTLYN